MARLIQCIMATICVETLVIYEFICICRIINKEWIVEKLWNKLLPNKQFEEIEFFVFIRPKFLQVSLITYLLSAQILKQIPLFKLLLLLMPILAIATGIKNNC